MQEHAARLLDEVSHTQAKTGFLAGALVGLAVGVAIVATVATGGAALAIVAAVGGAVATTGGLALAGEALGETFTEATGPIVQVGSPNVFVNGRPAARAKLDGAQCSHHAGPPSLIAQGSGSVLINSQPAARKTELCQCGAKITQASANVVIGGPTVTVLEVSPEVPTWMNQLAEGMVIVGSAVALGAGALAAAVGGGVCGLIAFAGETAGGLVGGLIGGKVGGDVGEALFGPRGRIVGETLGGFLGGFAGAKAGGRMSAGHPVDVASGELFTEHVDFAVPGPLPLVWSRFWISSSTRGVANGGPLGEKWHHSFDAALTPVPDGSGWAARLSDGRYVLFGPPAPLRPSLNLVEGLVLSTDGKDGYWLTDFDGLRYDFGLPHPRTGVRALSRLSDPNGNAITFERAAGRLVSMLDSGGRFYEVESDARGRIVGVDGPHPEYPGRRLRLVSYAYDGDGDLVRAADARGAAFAYRYENHLMVEERRPAGVAFSFVWDDLARGRAARCVDTWGRRPSEAEPASGGAPERPIYRARLSYDVRARSTVVVDGEGARRVYRWSEAHRVERETDALGRATRYAYDAAGRVTSVQPPVGAPERRVYDALGRLTVRIDAGGTTRYAYVAEGPATGPGAATPLGRVASVTAPDGAVRAFAYDARGNLVGETDPTGRATEYVRDARGLLVEVRDGEGVAARYAWSPAGELVREGPEAEPRRRYAHDRLGRVASVQRGRDLPLRLRRDEAGNVVSVTRGDEATVGLEYDPDGRVTLHRDGLGRTTRWAYDGLPFPVERVNADGGRVGYAYDSELRLTELTNPKGERYRLGYDRVGRLVEEVGFDGRTIRYGLDVLGRLAQVDDVGRVTRYARDAAGRVLTKRFADGTAHAFDWDAAGRLVRAESADAVVSFAYDRAGRVLEEWQELRGDVDRGPLAVRYRYDTRGRLTTTVLPDEREIGVEYGPESDAWAAVSFAGEELARVERDAAGREVARQAGVVRQVQEFDPQGRLVRQAGATARGSAVFARRYGYDAADQIVRLEDQARGARTYEYDACERLLAVGGGAPERFVVDPAGNVLARDGGAPGADAAPGDRLLRYRDGAEERAFAYDAWGNRTGERRAAKGRDPVEVAYAYDAGDTLREVRRTERGEQRITRFGYDALGRRVWKAGNRIAASAEADPAEAPDTAWARTAFVWSGAVLAGESECPVEDALATAYVYEPGTFRPLALARREGAAGAVYRYHVDHLGTPQELTSASGVVAWRAQYRAWGAAASGDAGEFVQPLRFPGQYADAETGLYYNRHRYYSPAEGRFVNQDPIRLAGGENLGMYAPNPVAWVDPLGLAGRNGLTGAPLLPGEGDVGTFRDLRRAGSPGDDVTAHHMPSDAYMKGRGVPGYTRNDGISMNMEQPHPGVGGRHRATASYGSDPDLTLTPRQALARDVWDARSIYMEDGRYTPEIRNSLREVIAENKRQWPGTFDKPCPF